MSGGSYDYLFDIWGTEDLLRKEEALQRMSERLSKLKYAEDAATETEELVTLLQQIEIRVRTRVRRLTGVWHAVEWWDSGDYSEDQVKEALAKYRKEIEG